MNASSSTSQKTNFLFVYHHTMIMSREQRTVSQVLVGRPKIPVYSLLKNKLGGEKGVRYNVYMEKGGGTRGGEKTTSIGSANQKSPRLIRVYFPVHKRAVRGGGGGCVLLSSETN